MGLAWDEFIKIVVQIGETSLDQSLDRDIPDRREKSVSGEAMWW